MTPREDFYQRTIASSVALVGIGLHGGRHSALRIRPAGSNFGIQFSVRGRRIPADWRHVVDTALCTTLGNGSTARVSTVEHLLAGLYASGVDNALIEVSEREIPIMDGSAAPFMKAIANAGIVTLAAPRRILVVHRPVGVWRGEAYAFAAPALETKFTLEIEFGSAAIGSQIFSFSPDSPDFGSLVAPARTFGFAEDLHRLHQRGLALGGSLRNAILIDRGEVANEEGLRFSDEFVRHKLLDFVGDVALAGHRVRGHFFGSRSGHDLNNALLHALLNDPKAWSLQSLVHGPAEQIEATEEIPESPLRRARG